MASRKRTTFVADGRKRARAATVVQVQEEIKAAYADQINAASWLRRWALRREMKRELRRRLKECAPPDALY